MPRRKQTSPTTTAVSKLTAAIVAALGDKPENQPALGAHGAAEAILKTHAELGGDDTVQGRLYDAIVSLSLDQAAHGYGPSAPHFKVAAVAEAIGIDDRPMPHCLELAATEAVVNIRYKSGRNGWLPAALSRTRQSKTENKAPAALATGFLGTLR